MIPPSDISLIVVLYHPSTDDLQHLSRLAEKWGGCVVDNTGAPAFSGDRVGRMHYISNPENLGIAAAQNRAIRWLRNETATRYAVFLDQDSRVGMDYPQRIADTFAAVCQENDSLALLGPTPVNAATGQEYHSAIHRDHPSSALFTPRRDVISAGSCVAMTALDRVGLMDEQLFIDYVDFDWCWRARACGMTCGITPRVTILQQVGRRELRLLFLRDIISSPVRYFYRSRNYLWLLRRPYVPLQWKLATGIKQLLRALYLLFVASDGWQCWLNLWRGTLHGLFKHPKIEQES